MNICSSSWSSQSISCTAGSIGNVGLSILREIHKAVMPLKTSSLQRHKYERMGSEEDNFLLPPLPSSPSFFTLSVTFL